MGRRSIEDCCDRSGSTVVVIGEDSFRRDNKSIALERRVGIGNR